jgi:hypothetical protein
MSIICQSLPESTISRHLKMCAGSKDTDQILLTCELIDACPDRTLQVTFELVDEILEESSNPKTRVSAVLSSDIYQACQKTLSVRRDLTSDYPLPTEITHAEAFAMMSIIWEEWAKEGQQNIPDEPGMEGGWVIVPYPRESSSAKPSPFHVPQET